MPRAWHAQACSCVQHCSKVLQSAEVSSKFGFLGVTIIKVEAGRAISSRFRIVVYLDGAEVGQEPYRPRMPAERVENWVLCSASVVIGDHAIAIC